MKLPWLLPLLLAVACDGSRILGVFPFHGKSHFVMFEPLMKGLARRGHQVDVVSVFPQKKPYPNYTDIVQLPSPYGHLVNNLTYDVMETLLVQRSVTFSVAAMLGNDVCQHLANPDLLKLLKNPPNDPPYDLVIIEICGAHCFAAVGHVLNVPVIGASSSMMYPWMNDIIANPENLAFAPNILLNFNGRMDFWQRAYNVLHTAGAKLLFNYVTSEQDELIKRHLGPDVPGVRELERNVSLVLVNSHPVINGAIPTTPAFVGVGGLHVQDDDAKLSQGLEKWLNESTAGFVYFSFGSMVRIETFPRDTLRVFYNSLERIKPVRVLMKVPDPALLPPGLPANIRTEPWFSQLEVLKHPNIRAFITHGGLMGTQEAIYCGVPMIGIPLFADQFVNTDIAVAKKIAVKLDHKTMTEKDMDEALDAVLNDPVYRETAREFSALFRDRPLSAMDTAIYWTEYVIRHGGKPLRSPAMDLTWWQVALLDVYACLLLASLAAILAIVHLARFLFRKLAKPTVAATGSKKTQ